MFWYTKSNAEHDKIKTPDFQIPVIYICEEKVYLWTYDIEFSVHFDGEIYVDIFRSSTTDYVIDYADYAV